MKYYHPHHYHIYGIHIVSAIKLDTLSKKHIRLPVDLRITLNTTHIGVFEENLFDATPDRLSLTIKHVAKFVVTQGQTIEITPSLGAALEDIKTYLLGSAIGAALLQKNCTLLHASVVIMDNKAIAFMGASGAGKSTIAQCFAQAGYPIYSDDICAIWWNDHNQPIVYPGPAHIKLWSNTFDLLKVQRSAPLTSAIRDTDKYIVPSCPQPHQAISLHKLYWIQDHASETCITSLLGKDKLTSILSNLYRPEFIEPMALNKDTVAACTALAQQVDVSIIARHKGPDSIEHIVSGVQKNLEET